MPTTTTIQPPCDISILQSEINELLTNSYNVCNAQLPTSIDENSLSIIETGNWCQWQPTYSVVTPPGTPIGLDPNHPGTITITTMITDFVYDKLMDKFYKYIAQFEGSMALNYVDSVTYYDDQQAYAGTMNASYAQLNQQMTALTSEIQTASVNFDRALASRIEETHAQFQDAITANTMFYQQSLASAEEKRAQIGGTAWVYDPVSGKSAVSGFQSSASLGPDGVANSEFIIIADNFYVVDGASTTDGINISATNRVFSIVNGVVHVGEVDTSVPAMYFLGDFATAPTTGPGGRALHLNDFYKDTTDGNTYIYDGAAWVIWTQDGSAGVDGIDGKDGAYVSFVYKVYNSGTLYTPPSGGTYNGIVETIPSGWSDDPQHGENDIEWVSTTRYYQSTPGVWTSTGWSTPKISYKKGDDGMPGAQGVRGSGKVYVSGVGSAAAAESSFASAYPATGTYPYNRIRGDCVVFSGNTTTAASEWYRTTEGSTTWSSAAQYINGNLFVTGSVNSNALSSTAITSQQMYIRQSTNGLVPNGGSVMLVESTTAFNAFGGVNLSTGSTGNGIQGEHKGSGIGVKGVSISGTGVDGYTLNPSHEWGFYTANKGFAANGFLPFTGSHIAYTQDALNVGELVYSVDAWTININQTLMHVAKTTTAKDRRVVGVVSYAKDTLLDNITNNEMILPEHQPYIDYMIENNFKEVSVNSLGEGGILVCNENGNIDNGDYLTSANLAGYAMKQDDDLLHSYTVAKALESVDWANETETTKLIACTYHAG